MQIVNVTACMPYATPSAKRATSCASEMGNEETIVNGGEGAVKGKPKITTAFTHGYMPRQALPAVSGYLHC